MIGKILGAVAGKKAARHIDGLGETGGALLGLGAATLLRRLGPLGLIAAAAGGYAIKHATDRRKARQAAANPPVQAAVV